MVITYSQPSIVATRPNDTIDVSGTDSYAYPASMYSHDAPRLEVTPAAGLQTRYIDPFEFAPTSAPPTYEYTAVKRPVPAPSPFNTNNNQLTPSSAVSLVSKLTVDSTHIGTVSAPSTPLRSEGQPEEWAFGPTSAPAPPTSAPTLVTVHTTVPCPQQQAVVSAPMPAPVAVNIPHSTALPAPTVLAASMLPLAVVVPTPEAPAATASAAAPKTSVGKRTQPKTNATQLLQKEPFEMTQDEQIARSIIELVVGAIQLSSPEHANFISNDRSRRPGKQSPVRKNISRDVQRVFTPDLIEAIDQPSVFVILSLDQSGKYITCARVDEDNLARFPLDRLVHRLNSSHAFKLLQSEEAADVVNNLFVATRPSNLNYMSDTAKHLVRVSHEALQQLVPQQRCGLLLNDNLSPSWKHMYYTAHACNNLDLLHELVWALMVGITNQNFASTKRGNLHIQQVVEDLGKYNMVPHLYQQLALRTAIDYFVNVVEQFLHMAQANTPEYRCLLAKFRRLRVHISNINIS